MSLTFALLIAVMVAFGLLSIYVGAMNIKYPDAAWARIAASLEKRGKKGRRTARWDRSRVFNAGLSIFIGVLLIGFAGWAGVEHTQGGSTDMVTYIDPTTGKDVTRSLTPDEERSMKADRNKFIEGLASTGGQ